MSFDKCVCWNPRVLRAPTKTMYVWKFLLLLLLFFSVNYMKNVNKHRLVLVKYIKRQRNLSKKVKETPNSTYKTEKKKK